MLLCLVTHFSPYQLLFWEFIKTVFDMVRTFPVLNAFLIFETQKLYLPSDKDITYCFVYLSILSKLVYLSGVINSVELKWFHLDNSIWDIHQNNEYSNYSKNIQNDWWQFTEIHKNYKKKIEKYSQNLINSWISDWIHSICDQICPLSKSQTYKINWHKKTGCYQNRNLVWTI